MCVPDLAMRKESGTCALAGGGAGLDAGGRSFRSSMRSAAHLWLPLVPPRAACFGLASDELRVSGGDWRRTSQWCSSPASPPSPPPAPALPAVAGSRLARAAELHAEAGMRPVVSFGSLCQVLICVIAALPLRAIRGWPAAMSAASNTNRAQTYRIRFAVCLRMSSGEK